MSPEIQLKKATVTAIEELYGQQIQEDQVLVNDTRKEFEGDLTVVVFPFVKMARKKPEELGAELGDALAAKIPSITGHNTIKGFLNLSFADTVWIDCLKDITSQENYGQFPSTGKTSVVEYCGPNTNKPLHIGHLRNMVLGYSTAEILAATGDKVHKVNILNDRGAAICKSMIAYQRFGNNETPESTDTKGDHFVGQYYVLFGQKLKEQTAQLISEGVAEREAEKSSELMGAVSEMLLKWEENDPEVKTLWAKMNGWVYKGYEKNIRTIRSRF